MDPSDNCSSPRKLYRIAKLHNTKLQGCGKIRHEYYCERQEDDVDRTLSEINCMRKEI